jgi:hypothetical protein
MNSIPHVSFVEEPDREKGERAICSPVLAEYFDSVYVQVYLETYITPRFQEWLKSCVMTRCTPDCDAVRIAVMTKTLN